MTQGDEDLGEQALNKVVEVGISSQLDEVEDVDVKIKTDPLKAVQGQVDSVSIEGHGMVMQKDLRMEEMKLNTGNISINPMSAAFGKIELTRPTEADAHVVLTEEDLNRAFNSDFVKDKLQNLNITVNGQPTTASAHQVELRLPGDGRFSLSADIQLENAAEAKKVSFTAVPRVVQNGQRVSLEDVQYAEGEELSPELTDALLSTASGLLDFNNFELDGMSLQLKTLDVQAHRVTLQGEALVEQFPSS